MIGKSPTVTVTVRALMARVNRKLAHDGQILKVSRSAAEKQSLGNYHVVDAHNHIACAFNDLAKWVGDEFPDMLRAYENLEG